MSRAENGAESDDAPILLIEDTPSLQMMYHAALTRAGYAVRAVGTVADGLMVFRQVLPRVVLLDLTLPDGSGADVMDRMLADRPETAVIVITANGSINKAVELMRAGAQEFLVKPFDDQRLLAAVQNAFSALRHKPVAMPAPYIATALPPFIGRSPAMQQVYDRIRSVSASMATVFITGESGTGKELCAEAVHASSPRATRPLIALNCGAIPPDLMESEVFGHLRGSFTGAISDKIGAAAAADGGTLFLDEICEMDLNLQTKLLRFLQTSTITPVGATKPRKIDVRIICATNRNPLDEVRAGRFREDLYYRLHVVPIHMPPLRERGDDVIEIAQSLLVQMAGEEGRGFTALAPEVQSVFRRLSWPGNVRQLINVLRNVVVLNDGQVVELGMLPPDLNPGTGDDATGAPGGGGQPGAQAATPGPTDVMDMLAGHTLAQVERLVIEAAIARQNGSIPRAAMELDVSPSTLYRKREAWEKADARGTEPG